MPKGNESFELMWDSRWQEILRELIDSGITKEQFKQFIAVKRNEKDLSNWHEL